MIVLYYYIWFGPDDFFVYPLLYFLAGGFKLFLFSIRYGIILPIDFHIFQRGWNHQPVMDCYPSYLVTFTINIPQILAYIYHTWILWVIFLYYDGYNILHACESNRKHLAGLRTAAWTTWTQCRGRSSKMARPHFMFARHQMATLMGRMIKIW